MALTPHDDVVGTLAADRSDQSFGEAVLPAGYLYLHQHLVRRWHGRQQPITLYVTYNLIEDATRYDALPWSQNKLVLYPIGSTLHLEWRAVGKRPGRAAGITSATDLLEFDHRKFWQHRLLLIAVNREHLGRSIRNRRNGTRDRAPWIVTMGKGFKVNGDFRLGCIATRCLTTQEFIDRSNRSHVKRSLVQLDNTSFLPSVVPLSIGHLEQ